MRTAYINRTTAETKIEMVLALDGKGESTIECGCGFLEHMLTLFARHGRFDLEISASGDTHVDYHHTAEDMGICLGSAFAQALGDCRGINRYGYMILPMDETLVLCAVDISGRGRLEYEVTPAAQKVGDFDTELIEEFFEGFVRTSGVTLHLKQLAGKNTHHILEGCFKAFARAMREAVRIDEGSADEIPSTKGVL